MSLNDWLGRRRLLTPDRTAIVDEAQGERFSYADLDRRASAVGGYLQQALQVQPGDRVACLASNRIEYLDLYFACQKIGAVLVPLNVRLPAPAIAELLQDCQPTVFVYESDFAKVVNSLPQTGLHPNRWLLDGTDEAAASAAVVAKQVDVEPTLRSYAARETDLAMILYTSGTTGRAKGALLSYRQIHWNALNTIIGLQLTQDDVAFLNMPLYHTGGWHVLFTPLIMLGGRVVLQPRFDATRCNERLGPEKITILFGVPTTLRMMSEAANFADADFSSVRFAIFGGESCSLPLIEAYAERGVAMRQGYGLTEAGPNCFSLPAADAIRKQGSIGFPNFFVETRIVRKDGTDASSGEVGELYMRGPHVCSGYWRNDKATAAAFRDGWIATGDLMKRDEDGYCYVVGRKKEMYVSGGENVYPAQVERVLQQHDAVALSAVIGVPDAMWGETGVAFVQPPPGQTITEAELKDWCRAQLAKFQCPTRFLVRAALPIGPSGKVDKKVLSHEAVTLTSPPESS